MGRIDLEKVHDGASKSVRLALRSNRCAPILFWHSGAFSSQMHTQLDGQTPDRRMPFGFTEIIRVNRPGVVDNFFSIRCKFLY